MAETVNSIRINTRLKTDGIAKDRKEIERQLKELEKTAESVNIEKDIDVYDKVLEKSKKRAEELEKQQTALNDEIRKTEKEAMEKVKVNVFDQNTADKKVDELANQLPVDMSDEERDAALAAENERVLQEIADKNLEIDKEYQKQAEKLEQINEKLQEENQLQSETAAQIDNKKVELETALQQENAMRDSLSGELAQLDQKDQKLRSQAAKQAEIARQTKETQKAAEKHNSSLKRGIKRIAKLSLGVLGVRMAYSAVRKIVSSVTDDNEKLKNTIDAIWAGLGSAFEPIINGLISGFATVLNYAFAIIKALTGINLISKANAKMAKKK